MRCVQVALWVRDAVETQKIRVLGTVFKEKVIGVGAASTPLVQFESHSSCVRRSNRGRQPEQRD